MENCFKKVASWLASYFRARAESRQTDLVFRLSCTEFICTKMKTALEQEVTGVIYDLDRRDVLKALVESQVSIDFFRGECSVILADVCIQFCKMPDGRYEFSVVDDDEGLDDREAVEPIGCFYPADWQPFNPFA